MSVLSKVLIAAAATIAVPVSTAIAQDDAAPVEGEAAPPTEDATGAAPADGSTPPVETTDAAAGTFPALTLMKGKIVIGGETLNVGLFPDNAGKPISIAPSIWYGVSDKLTVGVTHDGGTTMWTPRPSLGFATGSVLGVPVTLPSGRGICVSGEDGFCGKVYNNVSVDALFSLKAGKFSLAAHPALDIGSFDPFTLSLRLGALGTYSLNEKMTIAFDPRLTIGITERDFNKETIDIPAWFWYAVAPKMMVGVNTGISGPLDGFGDAFFVPLGFNFSYMLNEKMTVGADFSFLNLLGNDGDADAKMLGLRFQYAL